MDPLCSSCHNSEETSPSFLGLLLYTNGLEIKLGIFPSNSKNYMFFQFEHPKNIFAINLILILINFNLYSCNFMKLKSRFNEFSAYVFPYLSSLKCLLIQTPQKLQKFVLFYILLVVIYLLHSFIKFICIIYCTYFVYIKKIAKQNIYFKIFVAFFLIWHRKLILRQNDNSSSFWWYDSL